MALSDAIAFSSYGLASPGEETFFTGPPSVTDTSSTQTVCPAPEPLSPHRAIPLKPFNRVFVESTAGTSSSLWSTRSLSSASNSNVHLCQPAGARFTPSQNNCSNQSFPSQAVAV